MDTFTRYTVGVVVVHYDPTRSVGFWYATVPVVKETYKTNKIHHLDISNLVSRQEHTLEVILNGPGLSKARKKVAGFLLSHHIPVKNLTLRRAP